jgi:hypothetical protein
MKKSYQNLLSLTAVICLILLYSTSAFAVTLSPDKDNPNTSQNVSYKWTPGMQIGFSGSSVSGYKYKGLQGKTAVGTWSGTTWFPPIEAKTVGTICTGKWVPSGGEGGGGEPPPDLYCSAINKGKFPDKIEFVKPTKDKYIVAGGSVPLEIKVTDQNGDAVSGYKIDWSINQTGTYFSKSGGTGYTQGVSSASNTPGGTYCTVTATIQGTSISATSKKITVFGVEITSCPASTNHWNSAMTIKYKISPEGSFSVDSATISITDGENVEVHGFTTTKPAHLSGGEHNYSWNGGDKNNPSEWVNPGNYTIKMTVIKSGETSSDTKQTVVNMVWRGATTIYAWAHDHGTQYGWRAPLRTTGKLVCLEDNGKEICASKLWAMFQSYFNMVYGQWWCGNSTVNYWRKQKHNQQKCKYYFKSDTWPRFEHWKYDMINEREEATLENWNAAVAGGKDAITEWYNTYMIQGFGTVNIGSGGTQWISY